MTLGTKNVCKNWMKKYSKAELEEIANTFTARFLTVQSESLKNNVDLEFQTPFQKEFEK